MRGIWGLLGLVIALVIVMLLAKQQITGSKSASSATEGSNDSVRVQSQQMQQQVRQAMEAAMATKRDPDAGQ
ncbi:hypothetical protein K3217_13185 [bacterium BD-1]|nr:hypothetical protein [Ottowia caeni]